MGSLVVKCRSWDTDMRNAQLFRKAREGVSIPIDDHRSTGNDCDACQSTVLRNLETSTRMKTSICGKWLATLNGIPVVSVVGPVMLLHVAVVGCGQSGESHKKGISHTSILPARGSHLLVVVCTLCTWMEAVEGSLLALMRHLGL